MRYVRRENDYLEPLIKAANHGIISHNAYSAQQQICPALWCNKPNMGGAGFCEFHSYVDTFRRFLQCNESVRYIFGTLTYAPKSVSPTNKFYKYDETAQGVFEDPPTGLQKAESTFKGFKDSLVEDFGWRLRKLLAVTEYGSTNHTGRLHIHYMLAVSDHFEKLEVPKLIELIRWTKAFSPTMKARWPHGYIDIQGVENPEKCLEYLCKYLSKDADLAKSRFWYHNGEDKKTRTRHISPGVWQPSLNDWRI